MLDSLAVKWRPLARVVGAILFILVAGCAGVSKEQCASADWRTIGYEDGLQGYPATRIGTHRIACAKYQVAPDLAAYTEGRERGLQEYCQPRNGFRAGLNGRTYENVCPAATEPSFLQSYRQGRQIHLARAELRSTQAQLHRARDGLVQNERAADSVRLELIHPDTTMKRRLFLAQELERLAEERRDREAKIDALTHRTRELAANVKDLELQSPYTF